MQSAQAKMRTNWCYGCVDRVGGRRFRQLTTNGICQDCDKQDRQVEFQHVCQVEDKIKPKFQQPAKLKRKAEAQQRQELLKVE